MVALCVLAAISVGFEHRRAVTFITLTVPDPILYLKTFNPMFILNTGPFFQAEVCQRHFLTTILMVSFVGDTVRVCLGDDSRHFLRRFCGFLVCLSSVNSQNISSLEGNFTLVTSLWIVG